ncbi:MAG: pyrimidine 5'-nucleotidase [Burkholderiales bacterium]
MGFKLQRAARGVRRLSAPLQSSLSHTGRTWLFDLDNTLHDASHAVFGPINQAMTDYVVDHLNLSQEAANTLRQHYWERYGATLLGLVRHHGVSASHFLHHTHVLPDLEARLRTSSHDREALKRLPGRKVLLTNAPRAYALRVLAALGLTRCFDAVISIEDMRVFRALRPKPDARLFRRLAVCLKTTAHRCVLVEDTLAHQRSARKMGMQTAWMLRYQPRYQAKAASVNNATQSTRVSVHPCAKPSYVCARIKQIQTLHRVWGPLR